VIHKGEVGLLDTTFTEHAFKRVSERLHLSPEEVAQLLNEDKYVPLGKDGSSKRVHKLFYSEPDSFWFVAVQDEVTKEVVTVLPVDYHHRWKVSGDALSFARARTRGEQISLPHPMLPGPETESGPEMVTLRFLGQIINQKCKTRTVGLGRMRYELRHLDLVSYDSAVQKFLRDQLEEVPFVEGEFLEEIHAYYGKGGNKKYMNLQLKTLL